MLLCWVKRRWGLEGDEDFAGEGALEFADDLAFGPALVGSSLDVGLGARVGSHAGDDHHVESSVGGTVAAATEPV